MRRQTNTINYTKELPLAQGIKFDYNFLEVRGQTAFAVQMSDIFRLLSDSEAV